MTVLLRPSNLISTSRHGRVRKDVFEEKLRQGIVQLTCLDCGAEASGKYGTPKGEGDRGEDELRVELDEKSCSRRN